MPMLKASPTRTCVACREDAPKKALLRFVKGPDGNVWFDTTGKLEGRGAYVHPKKICLTKGTKGALRGRLNANGMGENTTPEAIKTLVEDRFYKVLGLANKAGNLVCGLDNIAKAIKISQAKSGALKNAFVAKDAAVQTLEKTASWTHAGVYVYTLGLKKGFEEATGIPNCTLTALDGPHGGLLEAARLYKEITQENDEQ